MTHLTVISWNVYRNARPSKVTRSLKRLIEQHSPDVILIQEAPVYETHTFSDLPALSQYDSAYAPVHEIVQPSPRFPFSSTGQLTLAKTRLKEVDIIPLPPVSGALRPDKPTSSVRRLALYTRHSASPGLHVGIYNVHLENRSLPSGRLVQVEFLLESVVAERDDDIVIVGGDMNTFLPSFLEKSLACFASHGFTNLFAAERRVLPRLDYFMIRGAEALAIPVSGQGSDHQPILAKILVATAT